MARRRSKWDDTWSDFTLWLGLLGFEAEVPFRVGRSTYRFDWARRADMLAIEYDGLGRHGEAGERGGHETRSGLLRDAKKGNEAQLAGWRLIRCHAPTIESGDCHQWIERALEGA